MKIEALYFDECPNYRTFAEHLRELLTDAGIRAKTATHVWPR